MPPSAILIASSRRLLTTAEEVSSEHVRTVSGHAIVWHNGWSGGYRTWMGFDKRRRIAAVVLTNSAHGRRSGYELLK